MFNPTMLFDFGIFDQSGRPRAFVETKKRLAMPATWARDFRRNLLAHVSGGPQGLFAFVTPDRIFTWNSGAPMDAAPDAEVDAGPLLAPYFTRSHTTPSDIDPVAFEVLVGWWLDDLLAGRVQDERLKGTGLEAVLAGGASLRREASV